MTLSSAKPIQTSKSGPLIPHPSLSLLQHAEVTSEKALHMSHNMP